MKEKMKKIKHNLKVSHDRKKSCANKVISQKEFRVGNYVSLKVKAKKRLLKLGSCLKLVVRYCGTFAILERVGPIENMLAFHISM